jgi:uncharacterized protein (TIGR02118 family)
VGEAAPFVAMCNIFCESAEAFQTAMSAHGDEINADVPNYTNVTPLIQVSEPYDPREVRN